MKRILLAVAASVMVGCASLPVTNDDSAAQRAFAEACARTDRVEQCRDIVMPTVIVSRTANSFGFLGAYLSDGSETIVLSPVLDVTSDFGFVVLVHEMVHYVDFATGLLPASASKLVLCIAEERAFDVSMEMLVEYGLETEAARIADWRQRYRC